IWGAKTDSGFAPSGRPGMTTCMLCFPESRVPASSRLVVRAQRALLFDVPLAFLLGRALVMCLFAVRDADFHLGAIVLPVHRKWYQGQALAFDCADQFVDLGAMQQQLAGAAVFGDHVGGCRQQRRDRRAEQEQFAAFHQCVRVGEIDAPGAQALHFPALQRDAGFVAFVDVVLVARALVERDRRRALAILFFLLRHARYNESFSIPVLATAIHGRGDATRRYVCRFTARRWFASRRNRCSISSMRLKLTRGAFPGVSAHRCPSMMASTWSLASTCVSLAGPSIFPPATRSTAP